MFLRNKKTGEVIEWDKNLTYKLDREYTSLKELCENYEDCEAPKPETWEPKMGDEYYDIDPCGESVKNSWGADDDGFDAGAAEIGNVFRTKKDAEKAIAWLKARKVLYDDAKGFKPDWGILKNRGYTVGYLFLSSELCCAAADFCKESPGPYFATREDAEASIVAHEEEWKTYLGVKK